MHAPNTHTQTNTHYTHSNQQHARNTHTHQPTHTTHPLARPPPPADQHPTNTPTNHNLLFWVPAPSICHSVSQRWTRFASTTRPGEQQGCETARKRRRSVPSDQQAIQPESHTAREQQNTRSKAKAKQREGEKWSRSCAALETYTWQWRRESEKRREEKASEPDQTGTCCCEKLVDPCWTVKTEQRRVNNED